MCGRTSYNLNRIEQTGMKLNSQIVDKLLKKNMKFDINFSPAWVDTCWLAILCVLSI